MPKFRLEDFAKPSFGYFNTIVLSAIAKPFADNAVREVWNELGWPIGDTQVFPSTSSLPSAVGVDMGDTIYVGINGTDSLWQILKYGNPKSVYGYVGVDPYDVNEYTATLGQLLSDEYDWTNNQFNRWGREVYERLKRQAGNRKPNLVFVGHSYGGAVVTSAAGFCATIGNFGQIRVITFGAPKVYGALVNRRLASVGICRWMNSGDPVPALPPSEGEIGVPLSLTRRIGVSLLLPRMKQAKGGKEIELDGSIYHRNTTQITPTILDWFTTDIPGQRDWAEPLAHKLTRYQAMTHLAAHRLGEFESDVDSDSFGAGGVFGDVYYETRPSMWAALISVFGLLKERWAKDMIEPSVSPFVPKAYRAMVQRSGVGWCVNWMGHTVMYHPAKTKCSTYRRVLDHLLRRMLVSDVNHTLALQEAFNDFAVVAAEGGFGFRPDVSTWIP